MKKLKQLRSLYYFKLANLVFLLLLSGSDFGSSLLGSLDLSHVSLELLRSPELIDTLLRNGLPHRGGVTVLVEVVVLADFVEPEHETSVRSDLHEVGNGTVPKTEETLLLDGLSEAIDDTVELDISLGTVHGARLSLHLLTDSIEGEGEGLSESTSQATVDEVLPAIELITRLAPDVSEDFVTHESSTRERNDTENGSSQTLVESKETLLSIDLLEGIDDTVVLGVDLGLNGKTGLDHIKRIDGDGSDDTTSGTREGSPLGGELTGLGIGEHDLKGVEGSELDSIVREQSDASNEVTLPETLDTFLSNDVLESTNETLVLSGTDLSDNLDDIEGGGESSRTNTSNTTGDELLPES